MPTRVIVLGGGVAGMSAAHELIERGFEVVVLERGDLAGGKARSIPVADDGEDTSGHQLADTGVGSIAHRVPGEHGFRFFPGFYKHVIDTMRRTPSFDGRTVADHLVPTTRLGFTQYGKPTFVVPAQFPRTPGDAGTRLARHSAGVRTEHRALHPTIWRSSARASGRSSRRARSGGSASTSGRAGGSSSAQSHGRRHIRSSSRPALRARWSPPRRARRARAPSATFSCS